MHYVAALPAGIGALAVQAKAQAAPSAAAAGHRRQAQGNTGVRHGTM